MADDNDNDNDMIELESNTGEIFKLEKAAAQHSIVLSNAIEDGMHHSPIPLANVTSDILKMIIEYCRRHTPNLPNQNPYPPEVDDVSLLSSNFSDEEGIDRFDQDFVDVDTVTLYNLLMGANYLAIQSLVELACKQAANLIKNRTTEEIRELFHITSDFTPEEEEEIRNQNAWAFTERSSP